MADCGSFRQHRYPLAGSGDTPAAWATLAYQIYQTATAANLGVHWCKLMNPIIFTPVLR